MSFWTDDVTATMERLRGAGWSCSQIASELGTTRHAVSGKLIRLGVPVPLCLSQTSAGKAKRSGTGHNYSIVKRARQTESQAQAVARAKEQRRRMVAEMGLPTNGQAPFGTPHVCAFPMWPDDRKPGNIAELVVCGRAPLEGESYCAAHYRLAYYPPARRAA